MNPFKVRSHLTDCRPAIIRLLIGIGMLLLALFRQSFLIFPAAWLNSLLSGILLMGLLGPTQIHLAIAEMALVHERRRHPARRETPFVTAHHRPEIKLFSVKDILEMLERSAIVDLEIISNERVVFMGVFSDRSLFPFKSGTFINKCYYLDGLEFPSIETFLLALPTYTRNDQIAVYRIRRILPE